MVKNNLLNTRTASFSGLISNGRIYRVPTYQRDYSWKQDNWEDLWLDIVNSHQTKNSHYMGAIVLKGTQEDDFLTIIDGQQRLATLSVLAIAIIDKINSLVKRDINPVDNQDRQSILRRTFLGDKDPGSLRYSSKLFLNENNDDFYQGNLVNLRHPRSLRSLRKSNQLLWKAFEYYSEQLENLTEIIEDGASLAEFLTETIARKLLFIQINVEDDINAYVIFETLNSRGVELSATDLLKNYLFSQFKGPDDLVAAQREWQEITRTVGMEKFPEFLKYFLSMTRRRVRSNQLFKLTKNQVQNAEQAFRLLEQLNELSELYVALGNPNDNFWLDFPNFIQIRACIDELNLFKAKQVYPALFAAYQAFGDQTFDAQTFEKLLKLLAVVSFRYTVVGGLNPNDLETQYNMLANQISARRIKTPRAAFGLISSALYVKDEKFSQDFSLLSPASKQKKRLTKYILGKLEKDESGFDPKEDSFTVEHILPQNPDETWRQSFPESQIDEAIYRLGNMTPLEPSLNSKIGIEPYEEKRKSYQKSVYQITQNVQAEEWTMSSIVRRQERMAKRAVHIWRVDY
ncbi:MAG: DUF262 domain-containing HNH endonuclease family protein [Phormidesmis sp.]